MKCWPYVMLMVVAVCAGCGDQAGTGDLLADADGATAVTTTAEASPKPSVVPTREGMLIVFLNDDASQAAIDSVRHRLEEHVGVGNVKYVGHEEAHAEFTAMFKDQPEMVSKTSPADLPRSLRVKPEDRDAELAIADGVLNMEGVKEVVCDGRGRCR